MRKSSHYLHFYVSSILFLCIFMIFTGCSSSLSSKTNYKLGDLRIQETDDGIKLFSFFVNDGFINADKSKLSKKHDILTKNQESLLKEHLKRRKYCENSDGKIKFEITEKQMPLYQEIHQKNGKVQIVNIIPTGFFGQCIK